MLILHGENCSLGSICKNTRVKEFLQIKTWKGKTRQKKKQTYVKQI